MRRHDGSSREAENRMKAAARALPRSGRNASCEVRRPRGPSATRHLFKNSCPAGLGIGSASRGEADGDVVTPLQPLSNDSDQLGAVRRSMSPQPPSFAPQHQDSFTAPSGTSASGHLAAAAPAQPQGIVQARAAHLQGAAPLSVTGPLGTTAAPADPFNTLRSSSPCRQALLTHAAPPSSTVAVQPTSAQATHHDAVLPTSAQASHGEDVRAEDPPHEGLGVQALRQGGEVQALTQASGAEERQASDAAPRALYKGVRAAAASGRLPSPPSPSRAAAAAPRRGRQSVA